MKKEAMKMKENKGEKKTEETEKKQR